MVRVPIFDFSTRSRYGRPKPQIPNFDTYKNGKHLPGCKPCHQCGRSTITMSESEHVQHNVASIARYQFIEEWEQRGRGIRNWLNQICEQPESCVSCGANTWYQGADANAIFEEALRIQDRGEGKVPQVSPCTLRKAIFDYMLGGLCELCRETTTLPHQSPREV